MLIHEIKNVANDIHKNSRWAKTRDGTTYRIVGVGRKWVRIMRANGQVVQISPSLVCNAW